MSSWSARFSRLLKPASSSLNATPDQERGIGAPSRQRCRPAGSIGTRRDPLHVERTHPELAEERARVVVGRIADLAHRERLALEIGDAGHLFRVINAK